MDLRSRQLLRFLIEHPKTMCMTPVKLNIAALKCQNSLKRDQCLGYGCSEHLLPKTFLIQVFLRQ